MRRMTNQEMVKRGCVYCADLQKRRLEPDHTKRVKVCIHDECPYHELDPYDRYTDYLKSPSQNRLKEALEKIFHFERGLPR